MKKLHLPHISKKRRIIFGVVAFVVVLLVAYVTYSTLSWRSYVKSYESWQQASAKSLAAAVVQPLGENGSKEKKLTNLEALVSRLHKEADSRCELPLAVGWQQNVLPGLRSRLEGCEKARAHVSSERDRIATFASHIRYETRVASIVERAVSANGDVAASDTWADSLVTWRTAVADIGALKGNEAQNTFRDQVVDQVKRVESAWQSLVTADEAQDRQGLTVARESIGIEYDALAQTLRDSSAELFES